MPFFVLRPKPLEAVQWTGSNLAQMQAFVNPGVSLTVNPDNTLTTSLAISVAPGAYILKTGSSATTLTQMYQEVPSGDQDDYVFRSQILDLYVPQRRRAEVSVPTLILLEKDTITVTWSTPMPSDDYAITVLPKGAATLVGGINYSLVSQTAAGCVIAVQATVALTLGQLKLLVSAIN